MSGSSKAHVALVVLQQKHGEGLLEVASEHSHLLGAGSASPASQLEVDQRHIAPGPVLALHHPLNLDWLHPPPLQVHPICDVHARYIDFEVLRLASRQWGFEFLFFLLFLLLLLRTRLLFLFFFFFHYYLRLLLLFLLLLFLLLLFAFLYLFLFWLRGRFYLFFSFLFLRLPFLVFNI